MSDRLKPNFFIIGAPKCATTSMAAWLAAHPYIFMSPKKEPHFFNTDERQEVSDLEEYMRLFQDARRQHVAIGEASVWYLYSSVAVENILHFQPDAKFIVMVRNPLEMAPALHAEMVLGGHENVRDFARAWQLQQVRRCGDGVPTLSWAQRRFLYGEVCSLGAQLARLLSLVPQERVLVIVYDDLKTDAHREYLRVLDFLGVPDDGRGVFPIYNTARKAKWPWATRGLFVLVQLKRRTGIPIRTNLFSRLRKINEIAAPRDPIPAELQTRLKRYFAPDVALLGQLLGRSFDSWLA
jgi:hypothetical protein